jgi:hypothetical protein
MTATPDPRSWPALLHRLATSWSALLRLLFGLAAVVAIITIALCFLGDVSVHLGPLVIEHRLEPTFVLTSA